MSDRDFIGRVEDGVAHAIFNRPDSYNAWTEDMRIGLLSFLRDCAGDRGVRCLVLSGAGNHFMAGGDVKSFAPRLDAPPEDRAESFAQSVRDLNKIVEALQASPFPVVARIQGACAGLGLSFMLNCDLALASDRAHFTFAYTKIGATPDGGSSYHLPKLVGRRRALEIALLSDRISGEEALRLGLVNRLVPAADLDNATAELVQRLSEGAVAAMVRTRRMIRNSETATLGEILDQEADAFAACARGPDLGEGVRAFLEKRDPKFTDR